MLRRGFKAQSERRAIEVRRSLRLTSIAALSAMDVARWMSVHVCSASDVPDVDPRDLRQITKIDSDCWSAFTLRISDSHLIIYNPSQSPPRVNSVLMHELAHVLLGHELIETTTTIDGNLSPSHYDQDQEDEANWLAGSLLLPRPALLHVRRKRWNDAEACKHYQVSLDMLTWRFRMTGVDYQLKARR